MECIAKELGVADVTPAPPEKTSSARCFSCSQLPPPVTGPTYDIARAKRMVIQSCLVLYNPFGGGGSAVKAWHLAKRVLVARGIRVEDIPTQHAGHACTIARDHCLDGVDVVVVVGGDGTIHEAVSDIHARIRSD
jgi:hypothetical protein